MRNIDASVESYLDYVRSGGLAPVEELREHLDQVFQAAAEVKKRDGKAILVYKVKGYPWRFVSNLIASRRGLYRVLGAGSDVEAYRALQRALAEPGGFEDPGPGGFREYFEELPEPGLDMLPALRFYRDDGGFYLTSPVFIACRGGVCNASIHRVMVSVDRSYAAVRVVPRHLYTLLREAGGSLPVALAVGLDPRVLLAAASSPPLGVFELAVASGLLGGLRVCRTPLHGLPVPCGASMVIEARLGPDRKPEGPFTDLLQLYDRVREEPVLHVERIYVNKVYEPMIHVILPGGVEHMLLMGFPREAAIYDAVAKAVTRVHKVRLTPGGGMWLHAVISITKSHDGDGKTAGLAALAAHPSLKHVVVVDDDIDPDDPVQVEWALATRLQADRGIVIVPHARGSTLDPSAEDGLTTKLVVDATAPLRARERYRRPRIPGGDE